MSDTNIEDELEGEYGFNLCKGMEHLNMNQMPSTFSLTQSETSVEVPKDKYGIWYKQLCELQDLGLDKIALATCSKNVRRMYKNKFTKSSRTDKSKKKSQLDADSNFNECECSEERSSPRYNSPRSSKSTISQDDLSFVDCNCPQRSI